MLPGIRYVMQTRVVVNDEPEDIIYNHVRYKRQNKPVTIQRPGSLFVTTENVLYVPRNCLCARIEHADEVMENEVDFLPIQKAYLWEKKRSVSN